MNQLTESIFMVLSEDLDVSYESDLAEFYDPYIDTAMEGFGSDFKDNIGAYMTALQQVNTQIPKAIADSDADGIREACNKGIKLCERFREELKKLPKDKFSSIRNLMPCFKSLMTIGSVILACGGAKALGNVPALAPIKNFANRVLGSGEGFGKEGKVKLPKLIKGVILYKLPLVSAFISDSSGGESDGILSKLFKGVGYLNAAKRIIMSIKGAVNQINEQNKYAKMVREEDKDDQNAGNRQYMAMLGQIEEMIASYKAMIADADNIVATAKDSDKQATESLNMIYDYLLDVYPANEADTIFMDAYSEAIAPAVEAMGVTGLDKIYATYNPIFEEIAVNIAAAHRNHDVQKLERVCDQGIHSCKRMKAELKALPVDEYAKLKNFVPNMVVISCIWSIVGCAASTYRLNKEVFGQFTSNMMQDVGVDISKAIFSGPLNGVIGSPSEDEIADAIGMISDLFNALSDFFFAFGKISILPAHFIRRAKPFAKTIVDTVIRSFKESKLAKVCTETEATDPNIKNKKYRLALAQVDLTIAMYEDIRRAGMLTPVIVVESWLVAEEPKKCWLL